MSISSKDKKKVSKKNKPLVAICMGSESDLEMMEGAVRQFEFFGVKYDVNIVSAHRTPEAMIEFGKSADKKGYKIIIAGAGGAAHLPGMLASVSMLPVIGVPVKSKKSMDGLDSLLSIVQMPSGIPVATMAIDGSENAALLAVRILSLSDENLKKKLYLFQESLKKKVEDQQAKLKKNKKK